MVGDPINDLRVDNHRAAGNEVRNKFTDLDALVIDLEPMLLIDRNSSEPKLNDERIFVGFLMNSVAQRV